MKRFINRESIKIFKEPFEAPANEAQRQMLLKLLAEEEAKLGNCVRRSGNKKNGSQTTDGSKFTATGKRPGVDLTQRFLSS